MNFVNFRDIASHYSTNSSESSSGRADISSKRTILKMEPTIANERIAAQDLSLDLREQAEHLGTFQQSRRSSVATNNSYFPIRQGLTLIPTFDGTNIPVNQFTSDCRGASNLIDPDDREFFFRAILQTKLTGDAALLRSIHTFNNLETLCFTLEKEFNKYKSFDQWELEANNLRQFKGESIEDYVNRTKKLNTDLILAISNYPDPTARAGLKIFAANKLTDHFLGGLDRSIGQHLLSQKFHSLDDAIESATRFVTKSRYHAERVQVSQLCYSQ